MSEVKKITYNEIGHKYLHYEVEKYSQEQSEVHLANCQNSNVI
jgi:hypothetical protein